VKKLGVTFVIGQSFYLREKENYKKNTTEIAPSFCVCRWSHKTGSSKKQPYLPLKRSA